MFVNFHDPVLHLGGRHLSFEDGPKLLEVSMKKQVLLNASKLNNFISIGLNKMGCNKNEADRIANSLMNKKDLILKLHIECAKTMVYKILSIRAEVRLFWISLH